HEDMDSLRLKIDELNNILKNHQIIKNPPKNEQDSIGVGATILVDVNGKKEEFTVVGTLEANPDLGKISNESPVGMALLGRKVGQEIVIDAPTKKVYKIKNIKYEIT
ncbi:MAG: GreA/GreB family elongation factor, partial [Patescibacteria group bacterium]